MNRYTRSWKAGQRVKVQKGDGVLRGVVSDVVVTERKPLTPEKTFVIAWDDGAVEKFRNGTVQMATIQAD